MNVASAFASQGGSPLSVNERAGGARVALRLPGARHARDLTVLLSSQDPEVT